MLPVYKVQLLNEEVFSSILNLENIQKRDIKVLALEHLCYIVVGGFIQAVVETSSVDASLLTTRLRKNLD